MHDVMTGYVKRGDLPGLVFLLCRHGEVHVDAIGTMSIGGRDPMRARHDLPHRVADQARRRPWRR